MKKHFARNSGLLSLVSAAVTVLFFILAVGSGGGTLFREEKSYDEKTGIYQDITYQRTYQNGQEVWYVASVREGQQNRHGQWIGVVKFSHYNVRGEVVSTDYEQYIQYYDHRKREIYTHYNKTLYTIKGNDTIYHRTDSYAGKVHIGKVEKSARIGANGLSAWQILDNEYPWYLHMMNGRGFSNEEMKALTDTIDAMLEEIDYADIIDKLKSITPFDEILKSNDFVKYQLALENAKEDPFRMGVIDYYLSPGKTIYEIVKNDYYSYYRDNFDGDDGSREHFERFCSDIQDSLKIYPPVGISDPFLADSVDSYLYTIILNIMNDDDNDDELSDNLNAVFLKSASFSSLKKLRSKADLPSVLKNMPAGKLSGYLMKSGSSVIAKHFSVSEYDIRSFVSTIVFDIYTRANDKTDIIREAVEKAWRLKNGAATEPVVVIWQADNLTATSVEITGLVTWDGGDPVTSRGVVWSDSYEPTLEDNEIKAGAGTGEFKVTISGLENGKTYYARSYAVNSVGTVYGNNVKFTASLPSGIGETAGNLNDFLVYPNPARERATVRFSLASSERVTLQVTDLSGKEMLNRRSETFPQGSYQFNLDLTSFRSGIYICTLTTATERLEQKIMVNR